MTRASQSFENVPASDQKTQGAASREILDKVVAGLLTFKPEMLVSSRSRYDDPKWDFGRSTNARVFVTTGSKFVIPWGRWQMRFCLPDGMVADMKRFAFLRLNCSIGLLDTSTEPSVLTLVREIRILFAFMGTICESLTTARVCLIQNLSDVRTADIGVALSTWAGSDNSDVRRVLSYLASPLIGKTLDAGPVLWTDADVYVARSVAPEKSRHKRLPEGVFKLLSNAATSDVRQFLAAVGEIPLDESRSQGENGSGPNLFLQAFPNFAALAQSYQDLSVARMEDYVPLKKISGTRVTTKSAKQRKTWARIQNVAISDFHPWITRARLAAQVIIGLYTGGRESELRLFQLDGLMPPVELDGAWVLRGTVITGRALDYPLNRESWVATPIMRDAIAVLRHTARLVGSSYLFHRATSREDRPVAYLFPRMVLNKYLAIVDPDARWWKALGDPLAAKVLHPHMMKESLAYELRKADCGIPAITAQLQHKSNLDKRINPITVGYGSIDRLAVAQAIRDANMAYAWELYHPDSRRLGGGAVALTERLRAKFEGYASLDRTEQEVFAHFVADGLPPLADVGLGYCLGRRKIQRDGQEINPPCVGSLRRNPVDCSNGIIPLSKKPIWIKLAKENRARSADPELFHLKEVCGAMAKLAEKVIASLEAE